MANGTSKKLAQQIWSIANDLRGNMDSSKFKDYILGVIFYRYLSAHMESYMDDLLRNDGLTYREALEKPEYAAEVKEWAIDELGYVIEPDDLFDSLVGRIKKGEFTIENFETAINNLVETTVGQRSETAFNNLFDAMDLRDSDLGKEVSDRTELIKKVILKIYDTPFAATSEAGDVLGTAYMHLIGLFQSSAGKKGGEFFTPTAVSTLLAQLTTIGLTEVKNVSDGCAGSGSLLLEVARHLPEGKVSHYYAQEKMGATFNLLRMNLIMHGVDYKQFTVFNDDTLTHDNFYENGKPVLFDIQVENPPYSAKNTASDESFLEDPRYKAAGKLAPSKAADFAFVESVAYHMADDGRAAILLPHGVLFRNTELDIRKYLIDTINVIDAIIGLPAEMFHGTGIPVCVMLLKKNRNGNSDDILFIDASRCFVKEGKKNTLRASDVKRIVDCVQNRTNIEHFSSKVKISDIRDDHGYNLNIPRYVKSLDNTEPWDIYSLFKGGMPLLEVDALQPYFDAFDGLEESLFEREAHAYILRGNARTIVEDNAAVQSFLESCEVKVNTLREESETILIENMSLIDNSTESVLADKLFAAIGGIPFVDKYDAYQHLDDTWQEVPGDAELINDEGIAVIRKYEPNMVLKKDKKSNTVTEEQDGWRGKVIPFELVQDVYLVDELAELRRLNVVVQNAKSVANEAEGNLTDEDKELEAGGEAIWDSEKNKLKTAVLNKLIKQLEGEHGDIESFDEDSGEFRVVALSKALKAKSRATSSHNAAKKAIEVRTMEVMDGLSDEQAVDLLKKKWIEPYICNISTLACGTVEGLIYKVESIYDKYEVTYEKEAAEIALLESEISGLLGNLQGSGTDKAGCDMWAEFLRGV